MIKIDPLYLLLLIEFSCILTGGTFFLLSRIRKYRNQNQDSLKALGASRQIQEDMRKQLAALRSNTAPIATPETVVQGSGKTEGKPGELEEFRAQVKALQEGLKEKTGLYEQLQAKFIDLEKEYMILYHQQQKHAG
jgi:predicted patatin/cPLA2 family phospholipase